MQSGAAVSDAEWVRTLKPDWLLTTHQVADALGCGVHNVLRLVKIGRLPAFRTPGGHRRIRAGDVMPLLPVQS